MNQNMSLVNYSAQAHIPTPSTRDDLKAIKANFGLIQTAMNEVLKKGVHYGVIPGTGSKAKPTLLKPGADVICALFHMAPAYEYQITDLGSGHREYLAHCSMADVSGRVLGQGVGLASTMETKYRYRKGGITCPRCGQPTIFKSTQDKGGGWFCWSKKGGCGTQFEADDQEIIGQQTDERIEHDNPADYYNTCLKMAAKRAQVSAVLTITGASALFTQDMEDRDFKGDVIDAEFESEPEDMAPPPPTLDELMAELAKKAGLSSDEEKADLAAFIDESAKASKKEPLYTAASGIKFFERFQTAFAKWLKNKSAPAAPEPPAESPAQEAGPESAQDEPDITPETLKAIEAELRRLGVAHNQLPPDLVSVLEHFTNQIT